MAVLAEIEDIENPGASQWVILSTDLCVAVQSTFDAIDTDDYDTVIKRAKPAASSGKKWEADLECLISDPLWQVRRNSDGSLSTYIYAPTNVTRKVRLTLLNTTPASTPVTITAATDEAGFVAPGFINPANKPKQATLHTGVANGPYTIELLDGANVALDGRNIPVTTTGPELSFFGVDATPTPPPTEFTAGSSETYAGTISMEQGVSIGSDRLNLIVGSVSGGFATMTNTVTYSVPSGRTVRYVVNGGPFLTYAQLLAFEFALGQSHHVLMIENLDTDSTDYLWVQNSTLTPRPEQRFTLH